MKLRNKTNLEICDENQLKISIATNVVEENNTKNKMRATSNLIAKALIATLGPYGSSTIIQDREGKHFATKDGYDLMNRMEFDDAVARTILDLFRTTASNQVFTVGDGSTSAIVVANSLFQALTDKEQLDLFKKISPKDIVDILNDLSEMVESELKKMAVEVSPDMHELDIIAAVANNNDMEVGKLIGDIYREIGEFGFISMDVLEKQPKDTYEIKSGVEWNRGYIDPVFAKMYGDEKIIYDENPRIILSNSTITYDDLELGLIPLMKSAISQQEKTQLIIVANDFDADALQFLKNNRVKHLSSKQPEMNFVAVDIDQVTKESRNKLEDLALLCGCKVWDKLFTKPAEIIANPGQFIGTAGKAIISPKTTQIIKNDNVNDATKKAIEAKVKELDTELRKLSSIEVPTKEEDLKLYELRQRKSRLTSSTAMFHVGGKTMAERMTRQRLIEDAIFACKSTLEYGYIPGGNICIPKILREKKEAFASVLGAKYNYLPLDNIRTFFAYFIDMITRAFLESYTAVLSNSYMEESTINETIEKCLTENKFYNLKLHRFEDWEDTQVINSVETDLQILKSCISIIGILSTSNQFITLGMDMSGQIR